MSNKIQQKSPEWFAIRRGLFTGSEIENLCKPKGLGDSGETYIMQKIAEILTPAEFDNNYENDAMRWGNEHEETAVYVHEKRSDSMTEEVGFLIHPIAHFLGASPDRKVFRKGSEGVLEIKCPYEGKNHIKHMMINSVEYFKKEFPKYYWQTVTEFLCSPGSKFVDFVSFDPRMEKKYRYHCFTFTPSADDCTFLIERVYAARKRYDEILAKINR
ncbi:MAG: hypothetical protein FGM16_06725 [Flavobacterium sp.]|nr:hypothetical protein [Flavobacterium sp.]